MVSGDQVNAAFQVRDVLVGAPGTPVLGSDRGDVRAVSEIWGLHHFGFGSPHYLFALLLVPLFVAFAAVVRRRRSRYTGAFTNLDLLADIGPRRRGRWLRRRP